MKKFTTRFLTVLLSVAILISVLPMSVFAAEIERGDDEIAPTFQEPTSGQADENEKVYAVDEDVSLRNENTKYIRMSDGSYYVALYDTAVHYLNEDDEWVEIDNTLSQSEASDEEDFAGVETNKGMVNVKFANNSNSSKLVAIKEGNYKISFGMVGANKTKAVTVKNPEAHAEDTTKLERLIHVKKAVSSVVYEDILENIDLEYVVIGNDIKENIIIKAKSDSYVYEFDMKLNKLRAELLDDGTIALKDEKSDEIVFTIGLPFLLDANGEYSNAVTYSLEQVKNKEYRITVTADSEWLNDESRAFPVKIDPSISVGSAQDVSVATTVNELYPDTNYGSDGILTAGYASEYSQHIYWKLTTLPTIPNNSIITHASLSLYPINVTTSEAYVGVYKSLVSWDENILTWNDIGGINSDVVDYLVLTPANVNEEEILAEDYVTWDITKIAKDWYYDTVNKGLVLRTIPDSNSSGSCYAQFASEETIAYPIFTVQYRSISGLEDYYTYQTQSIGRAGIGYINNYTSQLTLVQTDLTSNSEVSPFAVNHVYNSAYAGQPFTYLQNYIYTANFAQMKLGNGWKLNVQETVMTRYIGSTSYLIYHDADGTEHYFVQGAVSGEWVDEDGLGLTIIFDSSTQCTMTDMQGNRKIFVNGIMRQIYDTNNNMIGIEYNSSNQIQSVVRLNSGGSLETLATFEYDTSNYLDAIVDSTGRRTEFEYNGTLLTTITAPDTNTAKYTYSSNGVMTSAYDSEANYGVEYTPSSASDYLKKAVVRVREYYLNSSVKTYGNELIIDNDYGVSTSYLDRGESENLVEDDIVTTYRFDYQGRTIGVYTTDGYGNLYGANTSAYVDSENNRMLNNRIGQYGEIGVVPYNYIINGSLESSVSWTKSAGVTLVSGNAHTGNYSAKMTLASGSTDELYLHQEVLLKNQGEHTVSAYVNISNLTSITANGGIYIKVVSPDGTTVTVGEKLNMNFSATLIDPWQRISCTFTNPDRESRYQIYICMQGVDGSAYVDDIQLENFSAPSGYNFVGRASEWRGADNSCYMTGLTTAYAISDTSSVLITREAICIHGDPTANRWAKLTIPINKPSTTYMFSAWARGNAAPTGNGAEFKAVATVYYEDGSVEDFPFDFHSRAGSSEQFLSGTIVPHSENRSKTIVQIELKLSYARNVNTVYFYDIALIESAVQDYGYDVNGNMNSVNQTDTSEIIAEYDAENRLTFQSQGNQTYRYNYQSETSRLVHTVTSDGIVMGFTYDSAGNVTGTIIREDAENGLNISTSTAYTADKNYIESVTDSTGASTYYAYNDRGLLTTSLNSKGTRVEYDYNANNDRQTISYISGVVSAAYEYTKGSLSKIIRGGYIEGNSTKQNQEYTFVYDDFGNTTQIKVGNYTLVTYEYSDHNGHLTKTTYGNGTVIENVYDILDRIIQIKYNGVVRYNYSYNGNGDLYRVEDVLNDIGYSYEYDSLGRLQSSYTTIGTSVAEYSSYAYDGQSRVTEYRCGIGGVTGGTMNHTYAYTYDEADEISGDTEASNLLKGMTVSGTGISDTLTYTYDPLQRVTAKTTKGAHITLAQSYGYKTVSGNRTTMQIENYAWTSNGSSAVAYSYTYDAVGNILTVSEGGALKASYTYDAQNQLLTETLWDTGIRYEYTYDTYGNIRSVEEYNANTGALISSDTYSYTNSTWLDRLTAFNGTTITYDDIGNPLSYNNGSAYTFTWDGRELASVVTGGVTTSYTYGADGLRTQKQYGSTTYNYYYVDGRLVRMTWVNSYIDFLYDESGSVYSFVYDGNQFYYVKNLQGDVVQIYSIWGTKAVEYSYDAWGNCTVVSENDNYPGLAETNPIRYRGYVYDFETGFYYLNSRYYDPQVKRFINADDASLLGANGDTTSLNLYVYCGNNPVVRQDDSGDAWETVFDIISLTTSIIEVACNPADVGAWIGLVGDVIDVAVPFVAGVGETVRAVNAGRKIADAADDLHDTGKVAKRIHGNSLSSNRLNYGYQIVDKNNDIVKYGESKNPLTRYSQKWLSENQYKVQIKVAGTKKGVHEWQHDMIENYTIITGQRPLRNRSFW